MTDGHDSEAAEPVAPKLPMLVVTEDGQTHGDDADAIIDRDDVEQLLRTARAGVAHLALQLRAAEHTAAAAERGDPHADLTHASELLRTSLAMQTDDPPRPIADELAEVRRDALSFLARARAATVERVDATSDQTLEILRGPHPSAAPPSLRVVIDRPTSVPFTAPAPPPPPAREPTPVAAPARISAPPAVEPASPAPDPVPAPAPPAAPVTVPTPLPPAATDPFAGLGPLVVVLAMSPTATPGVTPAVAAQSPVPPAGKPSGSKVLYADVVLPMIAVVVLLVLLLAWVG